jgi:ABC-2 type transport system permease protein
MQPLLLLIKKEIKLALREQLVVSLGAIIILLLGLALYAGYVSYQQQQKVIAETQAEKREEWLGQGDKHPHIAAHYGTFAFKPKTPLSLFDFGLDAYTGTSVYLEAHYQHEFMFRPAQEHSSMIRFGELSAALVLQLLLPLLIIFLTFSSFTREREGGTLKLLLGQGVSLRTLIWGKILAYNIMLAAMLAPFLIGTLLFSGAVDQYEVVPDVAERWLLLALLYGLYIWLAVSISVWVSLRASSGRNAMLTLLSFWIFFTLLMPKTLTNISASLHPLPSMRIFKAQIQEDINKGLDGQTPRSVRMARLEEEYLTRYGVDSVQQLPINFEGVRMQAGEAYGNKVYDHHQAQLHELFHRQNRISSMASLINPFLAVKHLSMALSGTDLHTFLHFGAAAEDYRRSLVEQMNRDMAENSQYGAFYDYKASDDLWEEIADFAYRSPAAGELLRHYRLEVAALLLWVTAVTILLIFYLPKARLTHG